MMYPIKYRWILLSGYFWLLSVCWYLPTKWTRLDQVRSPEKNGILAGTNLRHTILSMSMSRTAFKTCL